MREERGREGVDRRKNSVGWWAGGLVILFWKMILD